MTFLAKKSTQEANARASIRSGAAHQCLHRPCPVRASHHYGLDASPHAEKTGTNTGTSRSPIRSQEVDTEGQRVLRQRSSGSLKNLRCLRCQPHATERLFFFWICIEAPNLDSLCESFETIITPASADRIAISQITMTTGSKMDKLLRSSPVNHNNSISPEIQGRWREN